MRDSTYAKRPAPKKRGVVEQVKAVAKDIYSGFGELKRQSGAAVETIKEGYRKVRQHLR